MKSKAKKLSLEDFRKLPPKDRTYTLISDATPLSLTLNCRHSRTNPLLWYDEDKKQQRALRYARNQRSPFIDEQDKEAILEHIVFIDGKLVAKKEDVVLQEILFLHPGNGTIFKELDFEQMAKDDLNRMSIEEDAIVEARNIDIATAESILRVYTTAKVDTMTSEEIKRDIRLYARQHPESFLSAINDADLKMNMMVSKMLSQGVLAIKNNKDVHYNLDSNKKKIFTIPLNEEPENAIIKYFMTDEGLETFKLLEGKVE